MSDDEQLQETARTMIAAAETGRSVVPVLKKRCPHVYRQIVHDAAYPELLALWGRSVNFDENARQIIVHPAILNGIGEIAGVPMRGGVVHAGLQHTYGYLFSLIDTPYGAKRDRWLSGDWERGFGIERSLLGVRPKHGSLLSNLTWFLGQIVHRGTPAPLKRLRRNAWAAAPELHRYPFERLSVQHFVEQIVAKREREVSLLTDLVAFPNPPRDAKAESTLLIYSVRNGARAPVRLITAFPVRSSVAKELATAARDRDVRPRYNAYLPGLFTLRARTTARERET